jgi:hypothetical protein
MNSMSGFQKIFKGFNGEWNNESPGGQGFQGGAQHLGELSWKMLVKEVPSLNDLKLDFHNNYFFPFKAQAQMLLNNSKKVCPGQSVFIAFMAERETLEPGNEVRENVDFVDYLVNELKVGAKLIRPNELKLEDGKLIVDGNEVTTMFMDFNVNMLVGKIKEQLAEEDLTIDPILEAIKRGVLVNPRSLSPTGVKSAFEYVNQNSELFSESTVAYTPWTRFFKERSTTGPDGAEIKDLVKHTRANRQNLILKPTKGYSGKGIYVGNNEDMTDEKWEEGIQKALEAATTSDPYIVQELVPLPVWTEMMPIVVMDENENPIRHELWERQTDFRCFIGSGENALHGFLLRFGGVPTNVGGGGGMQHAAVLNSDISVKDATKMINDAYMSLPFEKVKAIYEAVKAEAFKIKFTYNPGDGSELDKTIPMALRPRLLKPEHLEALEDYSRNLFKDIHTVEMDWRDGKLDDLVPLTEDELMVTNLRKREIDDPAQIACDLLADFGACLQNYN